MTSMIAPTDEPALRVSSSRSSNAFTASASGEKKGLLSTSAQDQLSRLILCGPICTRAARISTCGTILRATAPAATRIAVSRAEERPPPRGSRMPYFCQ